VEKKLLKHAELDRTLFRLKLQKKIQGSKRNFADAQNTLPLPKAPLPPFSFLPSLASLPLSPFNHFL